MRKVLLAILPLLVIACVEQPKEWVKSGAAADDLSREMTQCNYKAEAAAAAIHDPIQRGWRVGELKRSCLLAHGWVLEDVKS